MPRLLHEVAEDGDAGVDPQGNEDTVLSPDPVRQGSEGEGEGDAHELDHQEGADEVLRPDADLAAVGRGHLDDGPDPVGVEEEGRQEEDELPVLSDLPQRLAQAVKARRHGVHGQAFLGGVDASGWLGHVAKEGDGEESPPRCHRREGGPGGGGLVAQPEEVRPDEHGGVDHQEQPATHIAHGPPAGGHPVQLRVRGDVGKEGGVEDDGPGEADVAQDVEDGGPDPLPGTHEAETEGGRHPQEHEGCQERLLRPHVVRHRPQNGRDGHDDDEGDGGRVPPVGQGHVGRDGVARHLDVVDGQNGGHDRGGEG